MTKKYFQISLLFVMLIFSNKIHSQSNSNKMEHTETQKTENRIQAILTLDMDNIHSSRLCNAIAPPPACDFIAGLWPSNLGGRNKIRRVQRPYLNPFN
jgi:hypothetical protein